MTKVTLQLEITDEGIRISHDNQVINIAKEAKQINMLFDRVVEEKTVMVEKRPKMKRKAPCKVTPELIYTVKGMLTEGKQYEEITELTFASRSTIDRISLGYYNDKLVQA